MLRHHTPIRLPAYSSPLQYKDAVFALGSCFSQNISQRLSDHLYQVTSNPFGTLYNPLSVGCNLAMLLDDAPLSRADFLEYNGRWFHWNVHHDCSYSDQQTAIQELESCLKTVRAALAQSRYLFLTWGTAWVYRLHETGRVVANCHRQPEALFERERLSVESILTAWRPLLARLHARYPHLRILWTLSPIRHLKDGLVENQLSKATLLLAMQELVNEQAEWTAYFPAYEILLDDLRDYRYYADDLTHLSTLAIDYIWECFEQALLDPTEAPYRRQAQRLQKALQHRPHHADSEAYRCFVQQQLAQLERLRAHVASTPWQAMQSTWKQRL